MPLRAQPRATAATPRARDRHHRQVHGPGQRSTDRKAGVAAHVGAAAVHEVDRTGEGAAEGSAAAPPPPSRAGRTRRSARPSAAGGTGRPPRCGDPVAVLERRQRLGAERRRQLDLDDARPRSDRGGEAALAEDLDHLAVVRAHERDELRDALRAGRSRRRARAARCRDHGPATRRRRRTRPRRSRRRPGRTWRARRSGRRDPSATSPTRSRPSTSAACRAAARRLTPSDRNRNARESGDRAPKNSWSASSSPGSSGLTCNVEPSRRTTSWVVRGGSAGRRRLEHECRACSARGAAASVESHVEVRDEPRLQTQRDVVGSGHERAPPISLPRPARRRSSGSSA